MAHTSDNRFYTTNDCDILRSENVCFSYTNGSSPILSNITTRFPKGSSTAIVGESGSGKTTFAKLALGLITPNSGTILFHNKPVSSWLSSASLRLQFRKRLQFIFQDPDASLNPKMKIGALLEEVLSIHFPSALEAERKKRIEKVLDDVSLPYNCVTRYSFELSGGQKQRLALARALLIQPEMLILDEPLASLDASLKRSIITLLQKIQKEYDMTYIYVTHDLTTVPHIANRALILYRGVIVEEGEVELIYSHPRHPYTRMLLEAVPIPNPLIERNKSRYILADKEKRNGTHQSKCVFSHRCPFSDNASCVSSQPPQQVFHVGKVEHKVFCHYPHSVEQTKESQES